jgi:hypothetical protein
MVEDDGWFIDDVCIVEGDFVLPNPCYFEENSWTSTPSFDGWYASSGIWEVGIPSKGPYGGHISAATRLDGHYPPFTNSRLISPPTTLPASPQDGALWLSFWHYFENSGYSDDYGRVEISVDGGEWQTISDSFIYFSGVWTNYIIDISSYSGELVQFAFHFTASAMVEDDGWYIDNFAISEGRKVFNNPEGFEYGTRGWWVDRGVWEIGESPSACSGASCAATVLIGHYPGNASSRLITPCINIPSSSLLRINHRFEFAAGDKGYIEISIDGGDWTKISSDFTGNSGGCSPFIVDLNTYAGQNARFAFHFTSDGYSEDDGWFVDDVQIIGASELIPDGPTFDSVDYTPAPPVLSWTNPVGDFDFITIYAGQDPDFVPDLGSRIALVTGTSFNDVDRPGWGTYYKISATDTSGTEWKESPPTGPVTVTAVDEKHDVSPSVTKLMQNYPNPFNPTTSIPFTLAKAGRVTINIYNVAGAKVATLFDEHTQPGAYKVHFNAHGLASGVYFYKMQTPDVVQTRKMIILK